MPRSVNDARFGNFFFFFFFTGIFVDWMGSWPTEFFEFDSTELAFSAGISGGGL